MRVQEGIYVSVTWCKFVRTRELLFLLCFIASWTLVVVSLMLYPCIFCIGLSIDLFVLCDACPTVFVNCMVKQFAIVFLVWFLFFVECYGSVLCGERSSAGLTMYGIPESVCVLRLRCQCVSRWSFQKFCLYLCMSEVIFLFKSLRVGSYVTAFFMYLYIYIYKFCILCGRIRAHSYYASYPLVYRDCLP